MAAVYGVAPEQVLPVRDLDQAYELMTRAGLSESLTDDSAAEFSDAPAPLEELKQRLVLRSLSLAYGLAGAPCAAVIGAPEAIVRLEAVMRTADFLATPVERLALSALSPSRALAAQARIEAVKAERARVAEALGAAQERGPAVRIAAGAAAKAALARLGVEYEALGEDIRLPVFADPAANDRALAAFGLAVTPREPRRGEVVRDTKETRIAVAVDLDSGPSAKVSTGVGYFDHMLEQVATHGGFSLVLGCEGDTHIDAHHTIEDCALAFGAALKQALGSKRGIARFGFVLPMDETEAKVSLDLGGRPYAVFEGSFKASQLGEYPTEMTAHVFRSLAETLGAAIHVEVKGENDHHKTEACFKAFGRALRQAIRVEGSDVPSTKGVI
ncbi:MAG: imidazoleglycerol-phosphate dehydratase HisB [Proteobacteria bacterium]|nr:imidazoleglycerol-phosphate dehydratase HisB [Pseudomonadota bacterium]